jgi:hypothetical protein
MFPSTQIKNGVWFIHKTADLNAECNFSTFAFVFNNYFDKSVLNFSIYFLVFKKKVNPIEILIKTFG